MDYRTLAMKVARSTQIYVRGETKANVGGRPPKFFFEEFH